MTPLSHHRAGRPPPRMLFHHTSLLHSGCVHENRRTIAVPTSATARLLSSCLFPPDSSDGLLFYRAQSPTLQLGPSLRRRPVFGLTSSERGERDARAITLRRAQERTMRQMRRLCGNKRQIGSRGVSVARRAAGVERTLGMSSSRRGGGHGNIRPRAARWVGRVAGTPVTPSSGSGERESVGPHAGATGTDQKEPRHRA